MRKKDFDKAVILFGQEELGISVYCPINLALEKIYSRLSMAHVDPQEGIAVLILGFEKELQRVFVLKTGWEKFKMVSEAENPTFKGYKEDKITPTYNRRVVILEATNSKIKLGVPTGKEDHKTLTIRI